MFYYTQASTALHTNRLFPLIRSGSVLETDTMASDKDAVNERQLELATATSDEKSSSSLEARAVEQTQLEHELTPMQAIKAYPMAIFWSLMVSMCVIMEGYDTIL